MLGLKGSFVGFVFDGIHSSKLGITRVFDSDYEIKLTPEIKDSVVDLGIDGQFYFGSLHTKKEFNVKFAFNGLTEEQVTLIKTKFNDKKLHPLIFDEEPYKVWYAKVGGTIVHKQLCFEENGTRLYKGTGTYNFICPYPYAQSRYQFSEDYVEDNIREWIDEAEGRFYFSTDDKPLIYPAQIEYLFPREEINGAIRGEENYFSLWLEEMEVLEEVDDDLFGVDSEITVFPTTGVYNNYLEWIASSRLPSETEYGAYSEGKYQLYNAGDLAMPFSVLYAAEDLVDGVQLSINENSFLYFGTPTIKNNDVYLEFDMRNGLISGLDSAKQPTKNLYNCYITEGKFFELPTGEIELTSTVEPIKLTYHYLYI